MYEIAKRTAGGALLLLLMPLAVWVSGWHWQPGGNEPLLKSAVLGDRNRDLAVGHSDQRYPLRLVLWCLRFRLKAAIGLALLLFAALVIGRG